MKTKSKKLEGKNVPGLLIASGHWYITYKKSIREYNLGGESVINGDSSSKKSDLLAKLVAEAIKKVFSI